MENNWEPRVGQKVVALVDQVDGDFKKDDTLVVVDSVKCRCNAWNVAIGHKSRTAPIECYICDTIIKAGPTDEDYYSSRLFAPISEQYADMTAEIASQFKEHPDTVDQPVKVLETVN